MQKEWALLRETVTTAKTQHATQKDTKLKLRDLDHTQKAMKLLRRVRVPTLRDHALSQVLLIHMQADMVQ